MRLPGLTIELSSQSCAELNQCNTPFAVFTLLQRVANMHDNEPLWKKCARMAKEEVAAANQVRAISLLIFSYLSSSISLPLVSFGVLQAAKEAREAVVVTPDSESSAPMTPEEAADAKAAAAEKARAEKAAAKVAAAEAPWWHALMEVGIT